MGKFALGLVWLALATYAGYALTERSFAFLHEPGFGMEGAPFMSELLTAPGGGNLPSREEAVTWFESQSPETQACIKGAVSPERFEAALAGEELRPTPAEMLAVSACMR